MKLKLTLLALALSALPAQAGAWRSHSGNIFHFDPNGSYTVERARGGQSEGTWWWVYPGSQFDYKARGRRYTRRVYINGKTATNTNFEGSSPTHWTWIGERGANAAPPVKRGWFMDVPAIPHP